MKTTVVRAALATLGVTFTTIVNAQPSVVIPDAVSCANCSISTRSVVTLGSTDGPGALSGRVGARRFFAGRGPASGMQRRILWWASVFAELCS